MPFFGESEKEKKIRERADAAAKKAKTQYPDLPQEEEGLRDQSLRPTDIAAEALGQGGSLLEAATMVANPKRILSKMKGKVPSKKDTKAYEGILSDKKENTINYRTMNKPKPPADIKSIDYSKSDIVKKPEGPTLDYSEISKKKSAPEALDYKTRTKRKLTEDERKWWEK